MISVCHHSRDGTHTGNPAPDPATAPQVPGPCRTRAPMKEQGRLAARHRLKLERKRTAAA